MPLSVTCACGADLEAPDDLAGKSIKCPQCDAAVAIPEPNATVDLKDVIEAEPIPPALKEKVCAALGTGERLIWHGRPATSLVFMRQFVYMVVSVIVTLAAVGFLFLYVADRQAKGKPLMDQPMMWGFAALIAFFAVLMIVTPFYKVWQATKTCYALTNRRALILKQGLLGAVLDPYNAPQLTGMKCRTSWLGGGRGDLIFLTVHEVSRKRTTDGQGFSSTSESVKTIYHGFLGIRNVKEVERLIHEKLVDRFVDKMNEVNQSL